MFARCSHPLASMVITRESLSVLAAWPVGCVTYERHTVSRVWFKKGLIAGTFRVEFVDGALAPLKFGTWNPLGVCDGLMQFGWIVSEA